MIKLSRIPFGIGIKTFFSNKLVYTGLFVLLLSGIILSSFISSFDIHDAKYGKVNVNKITGVLKSLSETNTTVNEDRMYKYGYEFINDGQTVFGYSFGKHTELNISDTVHIEYLSKKINISRIIGTKNGPFSIDFLYMLLVFVSIGLILTFYPLIQKFFFIKILKSGFEIVSSNLDSEFRFPHIPNSKSYPYYRLKYKYSVSNRDFEKVVFAQLSDYDLSRMRLSKILVDSENYGKAYVIESLSQDLKNLIMTESSIANN